MFGILKRGRGDLVLATTLCVLGILYTIGSTGIRQAASDDALGPAYWPKLLGIAWVLSCGVYLLLALLGKPLGVKEGTDAGPTGPISMVRLLGMMGLSLAYGVCMEPLGYLASTLLFALLALALLGERRPVQMGLYAVGLTLALSVIFSKGLGILVPLFPSL